MVSSPLGGRLQAASTSSNDLGEYALRLWATADRIPLRTLSPGDETHFVEDVPIDPRATEVEHDVVLPLAEIRGTVRDAEVGTPLAGAEVAVSTSPDKGESRGELYAHASVTSDREGRFRLRNLVSRRVDVHVQHEGYAPADFYEIEVTPDGKDLDVRMEKGVRLHGVVTDETGAPLAGVNVGMDPDARGLDFAREVMTSGAGEFEFPGTATGFHILEVMVCGHRIAVRPTDVYFFGEFIEGKEIRGGDEANIQLGPPTDVVRVHVEDDTGAPLDGWTLQWTVHGVLLPLGAWQQYATNCGQRGRDRRRRQSRVCTACRGTRSAQSRPGRRSLSAPSTTTAPGPRGRSSFQRSNEHGQEGPPRRRLHRQIRPVRPADPQAPAQARAPGLPARRRADQVGHAPLRLRRHVLRNGRVQGALHVRLLEPGDEPEEERGRDGPVRVHHEGRGPAFGHRDRRLRPTGEKARGRRRQDRARPQGEEAAAGAGIADGRARRRRPAPRRDSRR